MKPSHGQALLRVQVPFEKTVTAFEMDRDADRPEYEIEIRKDGVEHTFEIDGLTGRVLGYEWDD